MKSSLFILTLWLGTSAWAQTPPQKSQAKPAAAAAKSNVAKPAQSSTPLPKPPAASAAKSPAPQVPQGFKGQPTRGSVRPVPVAGKAAIKDRRVGNRPARKAGKTQRSSGRVHRNAPVIVAEKSNGAPDLGRRRDPFVSPIVERIHSSSTCTGSGRQCLLVGEVTLQGVVQSPSGYIAVVVNGDHTYFLRENDPLANGTVVRITQDAITMRERSSDVMGRATTHEITRKIGVPAV